MTLPEQTLPSAVAPATLLSPKADLFAARAMRLRHLAHDHSLGPWLNWLADLCAAQQKALDALPVPGRRPVATIDPVQPLLAPEYPALQNAWPGIYDQLKAAATDFAAGNRAAPHPVLPEYTTEALELKASRCRQLAAGETVLAERDIADFLVAAALQVAWTAAARQLALPELTSLPNQDACPCCGSLPLGSIVMAGDGKSGLRYLECSLCATRWNAVRARCTLCADGSVVNYLSLAGGNEAVQAETCDHCHGYIKTFFQGKDMQVDPLADDLASLALDVLVGEQGYARGTPNLFLSDGEVV